MTSLDAEIPAITRRDRGRERTRERLTDAARVLIARRGGRGTADRRRDGPGRRRGAGRSTTTSSPRRTSSRRWARESVAALAEAVLSELPETGDPAVRASMADRRFIRLAYEDPELARAARQPPSRRRRLRPRDVALRPAHARGRRPGRPLRGGRHGRPPDHPRRERVRADPRDPRRRRSARRRSAARRVGPAAARPRARRGRARSAGARSPARRLPPPDGRGRRPDGRRQRLAGGQLAPGQVACLGARHAEEAQRALGVRLRGAFAEAPPP